jgi:hypothetical protein
MSRHARTLAALWGGAALLLALACHRAEPTRPSARPSARASSTAPPPIVPKPALTTHGCRVLGVKGRPAPNTPAVGTLLHTHEWIDLPNGVELELKHTETTRELSLLGPGRFLACADGAEAVLVARGSVTTTPGPGSRAGAEVELGTPLGVVHYADAALELDVTEGRLALQVKQGAAGLAASDEAAQGAEPAPVRGPKGKLTLTGKVDAKALVFRCTGARQLVATEAGKPPPTAGPERGAWAVGLVKARQASRLACARARAAVGSLDGSERARLDDQLDASVRPPNAETDAGK